MKTVLKAGIVTILFLFLIIALTSCRFTSLLHENEYLLNKNIICSDNKNIGREELKPYMKQKPNRKMFGLLRFHLGVYSLASKWEKDRKFKLWLKKTVGEPPVIIDTLLVKNSARQFKLYTNSKGYFNSTVRYDIKYQKKKAKVYYFIKAFEPFTIDRISYSIEDSVIKHYVFNDTANSLIKTGHNYDVDNLEKERNRLTEIFKNNGYFEFIKDYIVYKADSTKQKNRIDLTLQINNQTATLKDYPDSIIKVNHQRYVINNIFVNTDYKTFTAENGHLDTIQMNVKKRKSNEVSSYIFLVRDKNHIEIKPKIITQSIFIKQNDYYNLTDVQQTYSSLMGLRNFRFINFEFKTIKEKDSLYKDKAPLNCMIQLTRSLKQAFSFETEGTNSGGYLGIAGSLDYQNRNIFRSAEIMDLKLKGALEAQNVETQTNEKISKMLPFNTLETGIQWSLKIPKFLIPYEEEDFPKYFKPKTNIITGFDYQQRPDYTRSIANITFGYEWNESKFKKHIFNPIDLSVVKISMDSLFQATINSLNDLRIKNAYSDHLTPAMSYSFIYNNQEINKLKDFIFFRINGELAGNLLQFINTTFNSEKNEDGSYHLFNIRYAQYFRIDGVFSYYKIFDANNKLVFHFRGGEGFPFTNLDALPFEKSFYSGGANSIRAWRLRTLGPGSYKAPAGNIIDKTGDIDLEANVEYRFPIYKSLQGATFIDAGNVWLRKANPQFPGGEFNFDNFASEIAVGFGFGLRFDFKFFVIRLDAAIPVRDPSQNINQRWVLNQTGFDVVNYNIGIGYPF